MRFGARFAGKRLPLGVTDETAVDAGRLHHGTALGSALSPHAGQELGHDFQRLADGRDGARRMQAQGIPTWTWVPTGPRNARTVPPLPPSDQRPGTAVHEELRQIQSAPDADFCYGPSFKFSLTERKSA